MSGVNEVNTRLGVGENPYAAWGLSYGPNKSDVAQFAMQFFPLSNLYPGTLFLLAGYFANHDTPEEKKFKVVTLLKAVVVLSGLEPVVWPLDAIATRKLWKKMKLTQ